MTEVQIPAGRAVLSGNLTIPELDYCVKYSALDARHLGLNTYVIVDGCRELTSSQATSIARSMK